MLEAMEFEKRIGIEVFLTDTPGLGGKLKETAHDFIVDEISVEPETTDAEAIPFIAAALESFFNNSISKRPRSSGNGRHEPGWGWRMSGRLDVLSGRGI